MSSGLQFMYGHVFGAHSKKPHMDTVKAIHRSNTNPYITSPVGVDPRVAQPGPRNTPFLPGGGSVTTGSSLSYSEYSAPTAASAASDASAASAASAAAALPSRRLTTRPSRAMNTVRFRDDPVTVSSFAEGGAAVSIAVEQAPSKPDIPEPTKEDEEELIKLISEDPKLQTLGKPVTEGQRMVMKIRKKYLSEKKKLEGKLDE